MSFQVFENEGRLDKIALESVLSGELTAYHVKNYIQSDICLSISQKFLSNKQVMSRGDDVPGITLGVSHYDKTTSEYLDEVEKAASKLEKLFEENKCPVEQVQRELKSILKRNGYVLRLAQNRGKKAGSFKAVQWTSSHEDYLLLPHDDEAQLRAEKQRDFEIQNVLFPIAANFYIKSVRYEGSLIIWDKKGTSDIRKEMGISNKGYPYPLDYLKGYENKEISVGSGDFVIFNGSYIHAVKQAANPRVILSFFMGQMKNGEYVIWS